MSVHVTSFHVIFTERTCRVPIWHSIVVPPEGLGSKLVQYAKIRLFTKYTKYTHIISSFFNNIYSSKRTTPSAYPPLPPVSSFMFWPTFILRDTSVLGLEWLPQNPVPWVDEAFSMVSSGRAKANTPIRVNRVSRVALVCIGYYSVLGGSMSKPLVSSVSCRIAIHTFVSICITIISTLYGHYLYG
jgi:hypothetical protein